MSATALQIAWMWVLWFGNCSYDALYGVALSHLLGMPEHFGC